MSEQNPARELLRVVPIAWPTLGLAVLALAVWVAAVGLGAMAIISPWLAMGLATLAGYAAFTPMHDASHRSVTRARWPNELVGRLMAVVLMAPFPAFRWLHLEHHRRTNEPEHDPDFWSGGGAVWTLPLRWLTQDLHYYYRYFRAMRLRPKAEVVEAAVTLIALHALAGAIAMAGYGTEVLLFWLIPTRLALGMLAFAFDFLPHHPHSVPASEDRFQATGVLPSRWLTPLLISQNYHLVHHLYPGVPFYRYGRVWWSRRDQLIAKGARVGFGAMRSTSLLLDSHSALE